MSEPVRVGEALEGLADRLAAIRSKAVAAGRVPLPLYKCPTCCDTGWEDLGECITAAGNPVSRGLRRCPAGCSGVSERRYEPTPGREDAF
jgi:hypothetical protein